MLKAGHFANNPCLVAVLFLLLFHPLFIMVMWSYWKTIFTECGEPPKDVGEIYELITRGQDYKEKHKLDLKQISNSPC